MAAHLLIALLFVVIEVLPVMAKLLWRLSPSARAYEEAARSFDERGVATAQTIRAHAQIQAETSYEADLVTKDATLDRVQLEAEHDQDLLRIEQRAEIEIAEARTQRIAAMGIAVDDEFAERREAELRRRAAGGVRRLGLPPRASPGRQPLQHRRPRRVRGPRGPRSRGGAGGASVGRPAEASLLDPGGHEAAGIGRVLHIPASRRGTP